ncbi:MAG: class D sortase [Sphingomonadaceae bacterium]
MSARIYISRGRAIMRGLGIATALAFCICGIVTLTGGAAVPIRASIGQTQLEEEFERRLAHANTQVLASETVEQRAPDTITEGAGRRLLPSSAEQEARSKRAPVPSAATGRQALARLTVARLGVKEVVQSGDPTHDRLAHGPVLIKHGNSENPVTVLAAHRDTHFAFIRDLQEGDIVALQAETGAMARYRVTRFETVRWDRFTYPLDPARPLLALATCYPFDGSEYGGPLRRIAWAEQIG